MNKKTATKPTRKKAAQPRTSKQKFGTLVVKKSAVKRRTVKSRSPVVKKTATRKKVASKR